MTAAMARPKPTALTTETASPRRWWALGLLCLAFFMVILDSQIVILALPAVQHNLGFSPDGVQWVLSAYLVSFGGLLLLGGRAADLFGRRRMFMAGSALFGVSSLTCGLASSAGMLVGARVVQGCSAAVMAPTALSILMTTFEDGSERNRALGVWSATGGVGATAALLIGGPLTDGAGWQWIFLINVPVAVVLIGLSPRLLAESRGTTARGLDVPGALTITAGLVALVYGIVRAPVVGWLDGQTAALLVAAGLLIAAFAVVERRAAAPLLRLSLLRSRWLAGGNLALLALGMTAWGMGLTVSLYAQHVLGYSPLEFGLGQAAMTIMSLVGSFGGQAIVTRSGPAPVAAGGLAMAAVGCLLLTGAPVHGTYTADLLPALVLFGLGLGATFVAASVASLAGVPERESGLASSLNNASFQVGGALGSAVVTSIAVAHSVGSDHVAALARGYGAAFTATVVFAAVGVVLVLALLARGRRVVPRALPQAERTGRKARAARASFRMTTPTQGVNNGR